MKRLLKLIITISVITLAITACSGDDTTTYAPSDVTSIPTLTQPDAPNLSESTDTDSDLSSEDAASPTESLPSLDVSTSDDAESEGVHRDPSTPSPTAPSEPVREVFNQQQQQGNIAAGQLTAGEWNDNNNPEIIRALMQVNNHFRVFENRWRLNLSQQITITVNDGNIPVNNARVELLDGNMNIIHSAVTNNQGVAFLFNNIRDNQATPQFVRAINASGQDLQIFDPGVANYTFTLAAQQIQKSLDLMFVVDTTGSMGDELRYLQAELTDIVRQVQSQHDNLDLRLSVVVYRDFCCDFLVRSVPFSHNISNQIDFLNDQRAAQGGDWEEAVHAGLSEALEQHDWRENSTARLIFLVLDAPPHHTGYIPDEIHRLMLLASDMGVRIIPVASSGIDTVSEFLFRSFAKLTGGTYVFLTSHSGIGAGHIDPTVGSYDVRLLNALLVEIINRYLV